MKGAVLGLITGVCTVTGSMVLWNYLITPFYMHVDRSVVAGMLLTVFLPFNLVKGGINMGLTMILYKPIITALRKVHLLPQSSGAVSKKSSQIAFFIASVLVLAVFIVLFLFFTKVL